MSKSRTEVLRELVALAARDEPGRPITVARLDAVALELDRAAASAHAGQRQAEPDLSNIRRGNLSRAEKVALISKIGAERYNELPL